MAPSVGVLYDLAASVLAGIVTNWPATAEPLPTRAFVMPGVPAWDSCEQLTVHVERTYSIDGDITAETLADTTRGSVFTTRAATLVATLIRCVHDADTVGDTIVVPSVADYTADSQVILGDAQALWNAILAGYRDGDFGSCDSVAFEDWSGVGPEGGFAGGTLRFRIGLA